VNKQKCGAPAADQGNKNVLGDFVFSGGQATPQTLADSHSSGRV